MVQPPELQNRMYGFETPGFQAALPTAERHRWRHAAFVQMPEHVHFLWFPLAGAAGIEHLLKAIKRPFSYRVKQLLMESRSRLLRRLTIQQRPGTTTFRFWQEDPGYDRNLDNAASVLAAID
jgi:putative transposase